MGTPTMFSRVAINRNAGVRGVTAETPLGWSVPDPAERLAAFAKAMGWSVQSEWQENDRSTTLKIELGRMLLPGERKSEAKGDRWIYRLIWVSVPEEDRESGHQSKMRLEVCRALTPTTGKWQDGPSLKMISDLVGRHPMPVKKVLSAR